MPKSAFESERDDYRHYWPITVVLFIGATCAAVYWLQSGQFIGAIFLQIPLLGVLTVVRLPDRITYFSGISVQGLVAVTGLFWPWHNLPYMLGPMIVFGGCFYWAMKYAPAIRNRGSA